MEKETVAIHTPFIRLDQLLKLSGAAQTGGHAKEIIAAGEAWVNGEACLQRGKKIYPGDRVQLGQALELEVCTRAD